MPGNDELATQGRTNAAYLLRLRLQLREQLPKYVDTTATSGPVVAGLTIHGLLDAASWLVEQRSRERGVSIKAVLEELWDAVELGTLDESPPT